MPIRRYILWLSKKLFRTFCLCFYDVALWCNFTAFCFNKLASCYYKCMKSFLGIGNIAASLLLDLSLSSFNTVICNARIKFNLQCAANVMNGVIQAVTV